MPAKLERCVRKVRAKSGTKVNPWAVCNASLKRGSAPKKKSTSSKGKVK